MNQLAKFGYWLMKKRNFMIYFVLGVGIPGAASLLWAVGDGGNIADGIFLVALAFSGAYLGALVMWRFFQSYFSKKG